MESNARPLSAAPRRGRRRLLAYAASLALALTGCQSMGVKNAETRAPAPNAAERAYAWSDIGQEGDNVAQSKKSTGRGYVRPVSGIKDDGVADWTGMRGVPQEKLPANALPARLNVAPNSSAARNPAPATVVPAPQAPPSIVYAPPPSDFAPIDSTPESAAGPASTYGVSADQAGWRDNLSVRGGITYGKMNGQESIWGGVAIGESTKQLGNSMLFLHSGVAGEFNENSNPVSYTLGASKLARIVNGEVTNPLVASFTYDGYYDNNFLGLGVGTYLSQLRYLVGYALSPRLDVGAWAATNLGASSNAIRLDPERVLVRRDRFSDRVAAYASYDLNQRGSQVIMSAGWQDSPGHFFAEADGFWRVRQNVNVFSGIGYSANGSWDSVLGLEFLHGAATGQNRAARGECVCSDSDPCASRYRGGWANGTYRSALRVQTPTRMRRELDDPNIRIVTTPVPPTPTPVPGTPTPTPVPGTPTPVPPPTNNGTTPPPTTNNENPDPPTKPTNPVVVCPPRLAGHTTTRTSRLTQWLQQNGKTVNTCDTNSFTTVGRDNAHDTSMTSGSH